MLQPLTFDNDTGQVLGAMPAGVVKVDSSLLMLSGKFVDADGIIYDADGTVNEPATAAYAREVAAGRIAAPYGVAPDNATQKQDSVQQNSEADYTRSMVDNTIDNIFTTVSEIPGRVADAATAEARIAVSIGKWLIVGLVAWAAIKGLDRVPSRGHVRRYAQRQVRQIRKRAATTVRKHSRRAAKYIGG